MLSISPSQVGSVSAADGTAVAYSVYGSRGPAVVLTNGFTTSTFYWHDVVERLAPRARLVTWDLKGHGASEPARSTDGCSIESAVDDMARVMDAAGVQRAALVGFSMGCQIVLEAWRQMPQRIAAIAPVLGTYEHPLSSLVSPAFGAVAARLFTTLAPVLGPPGLRASARAARSRMTHRINQATGMVGRRLSFETMRPFYEHLGHVDPRTWVRMGIAAQRHSAADLLASITVPVFVVSGGKDVMTPAARAEEMTARIPSCERLLLPDATHTGLFEHGPLIAERLERFLAAHELLGPA